MNQNEDSHRVVENLRGERERERDFERNSMELLELARITTTPKVLTYINLYPHPPKKIKIKKEKALL